MFGIHNYKKEYRELMTGTLAASFVKTGVESFRKEYIRRLKYIGASQDQAEKLFTYESDIIKKTGNTVLADEKYIYTDYFDFSGPILTGTIESYVDHQMFTISEVSKICDEAQWHKENSAFRMKDRAVSDEVEMLSGYGEDGLLSSYLRAFSTKSGADLALVQQYSVCEQNMLILYKWNDDSQEDIPYGV